LAIVLAYVLSVLGECQRARPVGEDALARCRQVLSEDHPDTLRLASILAYVLRELGEYQRARHLGEDTLTRFRRVLGEDHPYTLIRPASSPSS
jgi:Tetratricopeptide repeat